MFTLLFIGLLTLAFTSQPVRSEPQTITVPDDYPTIQEAINNAGEGDTVFVRNGTYYENVVVNKRISLIGEDEDTTIVDGNGTGNVIYVRSWRVVITAFSVRNSGSKSTAAGIFVDKVNECSISDCEVTANRYGIYLDTCYYSHLERNVITENHVAIKLFDCGPQGNNTLSHNVIVNNNYSIGLAVHSTYNVVVNNTISNSWYGIYTSSYSAWNTFVHNDLFNNYHQVFLMTFEMWPNTWDNGFEGNYWSDYNGTDSDGDGIGDTPYVIDEENRDNYPLMNPLRNPYWNPADINRDFKVDIKDIAVAAKAFGSYPGHERWNPDADITGPEYLVPDSKVDIRDVALIAINYGEIYS